MDESIEARKRCGPVGPSTFLFAANSKLNPWNSLELGLGVCTSSKDDMVVSLRRPDCAPDISSGGRK